MANPIAVPGTNVPSGAAVSPGGAQGPTTVSANANNKATLGTDSLLLVQGTAAGVAATTHAQTVSGDDPQLTNARTPTAHQASHVTGSDQVPLASSSTKGLLNQVSGNSTDFIDGTNNSQPLQPVIWSVRVRSFNAAGNPTFECSQRNIGAVLTNPANGTLIEDRWQAYNTALNVSFQCPFSSFAPGGGIVVPGTNQAISCRLMRIMIGTTKASLAAGDLVAITQTVEGPCFRELMNDAHSISILARSNVGNVKFGLAIKDPGSTRTLTKICTLGAANTWALITCPGLPIWPGAGNFSDVPGAPAYLLTIALASGSTYMAPANDTWQTGNFVGALGQDNFLANAVNSYVDYAFIQHEPGAVCTTPIDCPFTQNYDDCLRYYCKSYDYATAVGATGVNGYRVGTLFNIAPTVIWFGTPFPRPMAKLPTVTPYNYASGAANNVYFNGIAIATSAVANSSTVIDNVTIASQSTTAGQAYLGYMHFVADTGW